MIPAHYFDGRSARLHHVMLSAEGDTIRLHGDASRSYPTAAARLAEPFEHAPAVVYFGDGSHAEVPDAAMRQSLAQALGYRKSWVVRWQEHPVAAVAALVLLVLLIAVTWRWGIPAAAERVARGIPVSADQAIGDHALTLLEEQEILQPSRFSGERLAQLDAIFDAIRPGAPRIPVRLAIYHSPLFGANALAFPDGTIVVTDQMVKEIYPRGDYLSAEAVRKLQGIMAHEIGHVEMRHSVRIMARSSLTAALSATLFGDFSAVAAGLPAVLTDTAFSRDMELAADDYAIAALHRNKISVIPLANLFDRFDTKQQGALPAFLRETMSYASTHPDSHFRSQRMRAAARAKETEEYDDY